MFLHIITETSMQLHRFAVACRENDMYAIIIGNESAFCSLVEQIHTHRRGDFLLQFGIDAVSPVKVEFLSQEPFCLRRHVLERIFGHMLFLGHHFRAQRLQDNGTERIIDADALLQGYDVVPTAHGQFLTATDERVDGSRREAC